MVASWPPAPFVLKDVNIDDWFFGVSDRPRGLEVVFPGAPGS